MKSGRCSGRANTECPRHGLLWPDADCTGTHRAYKSLPSTAVKNITPIRPPDLIIQDEFHLISGPLGTMVGLYETAINELCSWELDGRTVQPKIVASTATVRKAAEQVNNVFMRRVAVFPPHGLDVSDNFFSIQRSIDLMPGRRYLGVCSPGSSRPAMLIRVYTAFLTASQSLFDRFGQAADPYLTTVGYFNSLRELGGMRRLAEDDVQTRSYRVQMSLVARPGLAQRSVSNIRELTSRVSSRDIPKYLDQLEIKFKAQFDPALGRHVTRWEEGEARSIDVVLATNMLSVGVDVNRLGLMVVNGQPKGTAEYIQATSRDRPFLPGPRLHGSHMGAAARFVPLRDFRALPRDVLQACRGAVCYAVLAARDGSRVDGHLAQRHAPGKSGFQSKSGRRGAGQARSIQRLSRRETCLSAGRGRFRMRRLSETSLRANSKSVWTNGRTKRARAAGRLPTKRRDRTAIRWSRLLKRPGIQAWDNFTVPMSMREVEPGVSLIMSTIRFSGSDPDWTPQVAPPEDTAGDE